MQHQAWAYSRFLKQPETFCLALLLEVLESLPLPEPSTVPHAITILEGKIAIYLGFNESARRAF